MKSFNVYLLSVIMISLTMFACSDDDPEVNDPDTTDEYICGDELYNQELFDSIEMTTVKYGENVSADGSEMVELFMDIYNPVENLQEARPMIIWAFGGSFVSGSKADMKAFCYQYARKGYVTAAIDYRLLNVVDVLVNGLDSLTGLDIAVKATSDMRASVRHMKKEAANGNPYNIDPDKIIVGGLSAGGITALNTAIVDADDAMEFEPHIQTIYDDNGGLEGNSGDAENLTYDSKVAGVISLSGAVYRLEWLDPTDPPIASIHGDADETVIYGYGWANVNGLEVIPLYGSGASHAYMDQIGLSNTLQTLAGGGHTNIYTAVSYTADRELFFDQKVIELFQNIVCQ